GKRIVTASDDKTVRVWTDLEPLGGTEDARLWTATPYCMPIEHRIELLSFSQSTARADQEACERHVQQARAAALTIRRCERLSGERARTPTPPRPRSAMCVRRDQRPARNVLDAAAPPGRQHQSFARTGSLSCHVALAGLFASSPARGCKTSCISLPRLCPW